MDVVEDEFGINLSNELYERDRPDISRFVAKINRKEKILRLYQVKLLK